MASVKDPSDRRRRRGKSMTPPPIMSELRIVILGKSLSQTSTVGNFILGRSAFETEYPLHSVELHCESVRGHVEGRDITIINTPHLYNPKLSNEELSQRIKECVSLSEPGPHAFLLVVQPHDFTQKDRKRLRYILNSFSDQAINHSIVITTDSGVYTSEHEGMFTAIHKLTEESHGRQHSFSQIPEWSRVCQLFEKMDQMVKDNGGEHLICESSEDAERSFKSDDSTTHQKQDESAVKGWTKVNKADSSETNQASYEKLLGEYQEALELARTNLNSTAQTLQNQERRKCNAGIVSGVGAGLLVIPFVGWIAGSAMLIAGAVENARSDNAIREAKEEMGKFGAEVEKYQCKVSEYESKISQIRHDISEQDDQLKQTL